MDALSVQNYELWFGLGCALIVAEIFILGAMNGALLVIGLSFMATALATYALDLSFGLQLTMLAVMLIISGITIKALGKYLPKKSVALLNDREAEMVGKVFPLHAAITQGEGDIKIGDALYTVYGEDAQAGTLVRLEAKHGMGFSVNIA